MRYIGMKSKILSLFVATCLFLFFLAGCGTKVYDTTTLEFRKSGDIALHIVDFFDESKYSFEELQALNEAEVNVYNSYGKGIVTTENCSLEKGILRIDVCYSNDDAYYDINNVVLFYGNVKDAKNAGYNFVNKVTGTNGEGVMNQSAWDSLSNEKVAVVSEEIEIEMPGQIIYAGEGVTLTGTNTATVTGEGFHYIVSK